MQTTNNSRVTKLYLRKLSRIWGAGAAFAALTGLLFLGAKLFPGEFFGVYRGVSRAGLRILAGLVSLVDFSVGELLLGLLALCALIALVRLVYVLFTGRHRLLYLLTFVSSLLLIASVLCFVFYAFWGMNYYAPPLAVEMELDVKDRPAEELAELNKYLVSQANYYAELVPRNEQGEILRRQPGALARDVAAQFSKFTGKNEPISKYFIASEALSHLNIAGIFLPFTAEANVNKNNVAADLPFSMAHELAHRHAVAPEDEANFLAFYTIFESDDPYLAYSAYFGAIRYCQNMLYEKDPAAFAEVYAGYGGPLSKDLQGYRDYWSAYSGWTAELGRDINDKYLEGNGQADGTGSYSRMVDLMLAWFEKQPRSQ